MSDRQNYNDEIDLVDYFKVLVKRRWMIFAVTVVIGCVGVVSKDYGVDTVSITYKAEAWVMIRPPILKEDLTPSEFSMDLYQALAKAQDLADAVIDSLRLVNKAGEKLSASTLVGALDVEAKTGQTVLKLMVDSPDVSIIPPVEVANAWAEIFVQRNTGIYSSEVIGSYDFIREQYQVARRNLHAAEDSLVEFDQQSGLEALRTQLNANRSKLVKFQTLYVDTKLSFFSQAHTLQALERQLRVSETPDGLWVGSVNDPVGHADGLDAADQRQLHAFVETRNRVLAIQDRIREYEDDNDLKLLDQEIVVRQLRLNNLLAVLGPLRMESTVVDEALSPAREQPALNLPRFQEGGEIPSDMLWSLLSLQTGYNFFQSRLDHIVTSLPRLRTEIDSLTAVNLKKVAVLDRMKNSLRLQALINEGLDDQYVRTRRSVNELIGSIPLLKDRVAFLGQELEDVRRTTKSLGTKITVLETKRPRMVRDVEIFKSTFNKYANLMEEARIARGRQSGDVKVLARAVVPVQIHEAGFAYPLTMSFGVGLFLAIFAAFCVEFIERARKQLSEER